MSLNLAVATEDFGSNLKHAIARAAALDIDGLRLNTRTELRVLDTSSSALRHAFLHISERQLKVAGLLCPTRHAIYEQQFLEPRLEVIRKSMSCVNAMKTRELLVRCGPIPKPDDDSIPGAATQSSEDPFGFDASTSNGGRPSPAEEFSTLCELLNDLTAYGNHVGCVLQLQLTSYTASSLKLLLNRVTAGPLKIVFDPATAVMSGAREVECYRDLYSSIGYVRARDALSTTDGGGSEVAINDGSVNWMELIATIVESDYRGWTCIERTSGESREADVRRGVSFLKTLIPETGD